MTRSNTGLWNATYGVVGATLKSLEDRGVVLDDLKRIRTDDVYADQVAAAMIAHRCGPVYNAAKVSQLFSLGYEYSDMLAFGQPPAQCPGFLTFFDPGWDILRLRRFCGCKGKIFTVQDWYLRQRFATTTDEPQYRQLRLEALDGSFTIAFDYQLRLLPETEEVPLARAVVMGMVIHFLLSGGRLFERYYVRCADMGSGGLRVHVGRFDSEGFVVNGGMDDKHYDDVGLASSRKFWMLPS
jgi:hypothetical protein